MSRTYALWFSAISLFMLVTVLVAAGVVVWRSSLQLKERLRHDTEQNFEAVQHDTMLSLTEFLRRELFTSLYNLDIESIDITIRDLQQGMPVTSVRIADQTGRVLTDGTGDNPSYGMQLKLDRRRLEATPILIEHVPDGRRVTFRIEAPGYLAGYGELVFSDRSLRSAITDQNLAISQILREYRRGLLEIGFVWTFLVALLAIAISVMLSRTLSQPLIALRDTAARIANGELEHRVPVTSHDELGDLAAAFNQMGSELEKRTAETERASRVLQAEVEERRRTEQALRDSEERLGLARRAGHVGVYDWDPRDGNGVFPGMDELFGLPCGTFTGSYAQWAERVLPEDLPGVEAKLKKRYAERGETIEAEYRILNGNGSIRWISASGQIFYDADGAPYRIIGAAVDITDRKESQLKLLAAKEAAEAASRAKSEFLANMSHEMRTPLAGALGMITLVLEMEIGAEERQMLEMAKRAGESLLRLISDLLDFSRLEAGILIFEKKAFSLPHAIQTALEVVSFDAREKGLRLSSRIEEGVPEMVQGDEGRLRQVLVNLLGNSVKFTRSGEVEVRVAPFCHLKAPQQEILLFSVRDSGVGIAPEHLDSIFGKFVQVNSTARRRYGGTGLGLALAKEIVEIVGGRIWVESQAGKGSTFYFTYPVHGNGRGQGGGQ